MDTSIDPGASGRNSAPDGGWERSEVGHVQFASIFRDIGVRGPIVHNQDAVGWGLNLTGEFDTFGRDSVQAQLNLFGSGK